MSASQPNVSPGALSPNERAFILEAAHYLEHPPALMRVANIVGVPAERLLRALPQASGQLVRRLVHRSLERALTVALETIPAPVADAPTRFAELDARGRADRTWHKLGAALSGAVGGFFGLPGLAVELPVTTTLMLRAIANTAQEFGHDLEDPMTRLECLAVFSLGGPSTGDDAAESAYYAARASLAMMLGRIAEFAAARSAAEIAEAFARGSAPAIARLVAAIAARFDVVVTGKVLAESVPLIGAGSGAAINAVFMDHFCRVARYHFGLRRLEHAYGLEAITAVYEGDRLS